MKQIVIVALAISIGLGMRWPQPNRSRLATPDVVANWETGDNSQYSGLECPNPQTQFGVVTSPVREGQYAARFSIGTEDVWTNGAVRCLDALYNTDEKDGRDYYYAFSLYVPSAISNNLIWELHAPRELYTRSENCSLAPFAILADRGALVLRMATGNCDRGWTHWEPRVRIPGLSPMPVGKWIDFVIHIAFSERAKGLFELYRRVEDSAWSVRPQISRRNIPTLPYSNAGKVHDVKLYLLVGLYPGFTGYRGSDTIFLDDVVRGLTFESVTRSQATAPTR